jgi:hypothetical protein
LNESIGVAKKDIKRGDEVRFTLKGNKIECDAIELNEYGRKVMLEAMIKGILDES